MSLFSSSLHLSLFKMPFMSNSHLATAAKQFMVGKNLSKDATKRQCDSANREDVVSTFSQFCLLKSLSCKITRGAANRTCARRLLESNKAETRQMMRGAVVLLSPRIPQRSVLLRTRRPPRSDISLPLLSARQNCRGRKIGAGVYLNTSKSRWRFWRKTEATKSAAVPWPV